MEGEPQLGHSHFRPSRGCTVREMLCHLSEGPSCAEVGPVAVHGAPGQTVAEQTWVMGGKWGPGTLRTQGPAQGTTQPGQDPQPCFCSWSLCDREA